MLKVEYPEAGDLVYDYTKNISRGGTFILTQRDLPLGTQVLVDLSFPGLIDPIRLRGLVRWCSPGDRPEERGVGIQFLLDDPGASERLANLIERVTQGDPAVMIRTLRVLIVEDNPHVAALLEAGLGVSADRQYAGRLRFAFERARDGQEALARLREMPFELVISDIYMPVMDGLTFFRAVRADPAIAGTRIIAVSAGGPGAQAEAMEAGADLFVEKPMRLQEVLQTVKRLMRI
jgi:uncharacterized protein (TIGR02266 family)